MTQEPNTEPADPDLWQPADLEQLRRRYRAERDRRIRPDGAAQYLWPVGDLADYGRDPWSEPPPERAPVVEEVDAVVVGAGFGGLLAGAHLRKAGLARIRLVDTAGDVGGTWYWNRYPGVACDIESYIYLPMLEEIGGMPSRKYVPGAEIHAHAKAIAERFDLRGDALFHTEVTAAHWSAETRRWTVRTDRGDVLEARYVVLSSGPFNKPKLPGIPGLADFAGHAFHSSRWDYSYTGGDATGGHTGLRDKRVAVIGTGATAIQIVPSIADSCRELLVVQRTPSTVDVRGDRETDPDWWASLEPGWQRTRRENFLTLVTGGSADQDLVGDRWTDSAPVRGRARLVRGRGREDLGLAIELADHEKMTELRDRVARLVADPETAAALQPWYRQMCKRPGFSDRYLQAFNRDDVRLVDTRGLGVERITPTALVVDGVEHPVDLIIFATGFEAGVDPSVRAGADLRGRGGVTLEEHWADGLRTLHGWVSRGFPNLFHLGSTQNAVSVNFTHVLEEQTEHIGAVVAEAERRGALVEPTAEAEDSWVATIRERAVAVHEFLSECTPGYYNDEGRPRKRTESFGGGPVEFYGMLREWRASGGMEEVLAP